MKFNTLQNYAKKKIQHRKIMHSKMQPDVIFYTNKNAMSPPYRCNLTKQLQSYHSNTMISTALQLRLYTFKVVLFTLLVVRVTCLPDGIPQSGSNLHFALYQIVPSLPVHSNRLYQSEQKQTIRCH